MPDMPDRPPRCQWHSWDSGPLDLTMMEQCARTDLTRYGFGEGQIWWLCPEHAPAGLS